MQWNCFLMLFVVVLIVFFLKHKQNINRTQIMTDLSESKIVSLSGTSATLSSYVCNSDVVVIQGKLLKMLIFVWRCRFNPYFLLLLTLLCFLNPCPPAICIILLSGKPVSVKAIFLSRIIFSHFHQIFTYFL